MSVVGALFSGKWGRKAQESTDKHKPTASQSTHEEEDDEDESHTGFSRGQNPRNSRFYQSMRKKKVTSAQQSRDVTSSSKKDGVPFNNAASLPKSPLLPEARRSHLSPQPHRSTTVLPDRSTASTRHTVYPGDTEAWRGGVRGRSLDISVASSSQHRNSAEDSIPYQSHVFHCEDIKKLSEQTAMGCTVQEVRQKTTNSQQSNLDGTAHDNSGLRLLSNRENSQPFSHSLKIIKNIGVLYQEYRDTSKQQEIEQRRQRETINPGSASMSPPVLQLQLRNNSYSLSLWQNLEAVQASGLLSQLDQKEIIMQEAMFELITSEASYYKSLETLETHFLRNPLLVNTLSQSDMHFLFSNIEEVMTASERFLMDLEQRIEESILISDVCDIVHYHAVQHFNVFVKYVINQAYQEKNYRRILEVNQPFRETMALLEKHPRVRGLSFTSFLILPFQRITRLKLLVQNMLKKAEENSQREATAIKAHQQLEKIVKECNEGVRKMSRTEELISIMSSLEFKSKSVPVISHSRWLLKKGEVQLMAGPKVSRTMRSHKLHQPVYLFLFNNLLLITKRSGDKFRVLDSCTRAMLRTEDLEDQGQVLANAFNLKLLENRDDRQMSYILKASNMSEKLRWMCALTPNLRTRFMPTNANQTDSLQVQCIQSYSAQEPDELSTEMADVMNLLERTNDGWMMGERLHDGEKGWFPSRVVEEIQSKEVRVQNLREAYKIQQANEGGASLQAGARLGLGGGRTTTASSFSQS